MRRLFLHAFQPLKGRKRALPVLAQHRLAVLAQLDGLAALIEREHRAPPEERVVNCLLVDARLRSRSPDGVIRRSVEALRKQPAPDGMLVAVLFPYAPPFGFELFELTLLPGYERLSEAHEPGVTEHVIVLRGPMEVLVEGEWIELGGTGQQANMQGQGGLSIGTREVRESGSVWLKVEEVQ